MEIKKLIKHKYAQCGAYKDYVLINGGDFDGREWGFLSYSTKVIIVRGSRVIFTGYYSRTTSKQMGWWLDEYGYNIKGLGKDTLKIMAEKGLAYDTVTGELTPLTHDELREIRHERDAAFNYGYGW
uniref:DUF8033 domain-containing protein n=1 Tax=Caudovirales sp. ctSH72 TaxID=2826773 RepID=A0A8S5QMP0_9CAUD|nr:MAG TPA: hypothetical protein [Caudovirales sp. ctSH72]